MLYVFISLLERDLRLFSINLSVLKVGDSTGRQQKYIWPERYLCYSDGKKSCSSVVPPARPSGASQRLPEPKYHFNVKQECYWSPSGL